MTASCEHYIKLKSSQGSPCTENKGEIEGGVRSTSNDFARKQVFDHNGRIAGRNVTFVTP